MVVYIEYILLNNFVIDYVLIYLLSISFGAKYGKMRVFCTLCIALCMAVLMPYIEMYSTILVVYKLLSLCIVILPLKKYRDLREYMAYYFMTILYTFLLGGCMYGVMSILDIKITLSGVVVGGVDMPSTFVYVVVGIFVYIFVCVLRYIFARGRVQNHYHDVTLYMGDRHYDIVGYLDTGNFVLDKDRGVVFISRRVYSKILQNMDISSISTTRLDIASVTDTKHICCVVVDRLYVGGRIYTRVPCGIGYGNFQDFDCILHSQYMV